MRTFIYLFFLSELLKFDRIKEDIINVLYI